MIWLIYMIILSWRLYPQLKSLNIPPPIAWPRHPIIKLLGIWGMIILGILCFFCIFVPPNNIDSFIYHLPRILHWLQNRSVDHYPTAILRQLFQGPWSSIALLHIYALTGGDRFLNLLQWGSLIGCLIGVSLIAQELGANRWGQLGAMIFALTLPMAILQATTTQNDLICSFWLICFAYYTIHAIQSKTLSPQISLHLGFSLGLLFLTKGTGYILAIPLIIWLMISHFKSILKLSSLGFMSVPFLVNLSHYQRNFSIFQNILYTDLNYSTQAYSWAASLFNLSRSIAFHIPFSPSTIPVAYHFVGWMRDLLNIGDQMSAITFSTSPEFMVFL